MTLFNGNCDNCIYGKRKPIIRTACGSMVKGGLCLTCDFREKDLYNYDPNAYSFDNSNYFPRPSYENHLCSLCGNNSHDGYDYQQQFPLVHEQELSYNQNYDDNYYSHDLPSFPCCDNYGGSHETFQCQPITFQIDFSANHFIQNEESFENPSNEIVVSKSNQEKKEPSQEFDIHQLIKECSTEVSEKQKMEDTMLELVKICQEKEFLCIHDDFDDLIESALNSKLLLINSNSQRLDKKEHEVKNVVEQPIEHGNHNIQSLQNFRVVHKSSISFKNTSQISSIHAVAPVLSTKEPEHLLSMRYEHLSITPETESDEVTKSNAENLLPIPKSDEVTKSNAENLLPIPSEYEVTLKDKKECDLPISESSPVCDNHSDIFPDSKIDDDISVYNDDFEDIEYVEASLSDPEIASVEEIVSVKEENVVQQEEEEVDFEDISQIQDIVLREKLLSITRLISNIESLNDNSTPNRVLNSFNSDNSLLDNFSPKFKTFCDHSEETRSGNTTHANNSLLEYDPFCFEIEPDQERLINLVKNKISNDSSNDSLLEEVDLFLFNNSIPSGIENVADDSEGDIRFLEELLIDDSILSHESYDSNFEENPSIPRPPPEPPNVETDAGEEISVMMNDKDEDVDYSYSMSVIFDKIFSLLSVESEDTIFDPEPLGDHGHTCGSKNSSSSSYSRTRRQKKRKLSPTFGTIGQRTSILLAEETIGDEEEEYPFVNEYPSFKEELIILMKEELCPIYDTDNEEEEEESMSVYDTSIDDVIEEEEGFVEIGGFCEKEALLNAISRNQVIVVSGETGCGKTTQLPQCILNSEIKATRGALCSIICTQARRISAMSVAERVVAERGEKLEDLVGGSKNSSSNSYNRTRRQKKRKLSPTFGTIGQRTLILLAEETIVAERVVAERGEKLEDLVGSLRGLTRIIVDEIHERGMNEDFLLIVLKELLPRRSELKLILMSATLNVEVFFLLLRWGPDDPYSWFHLPQKKGPPLGDPTKVLLLACHGSMDSSEHKLIFNKPKDGIRKIVLATNMAKTSITINDVVFVVDCGKAKEKSYYVLNNTPCLLPAWISLQIKSLQLGSISEFLSRALQPPEPLLVQNAIEYLKIIKALHNNENLIVVRRNLFVLPVKPKLGKMLILGVIFNCLDPIITVVAGILLRQQYPSSSGVIIATTLFCSVHTMDEKLLKDSNRVTSIAGQVFFLHKLLELLILLRSSFLTYRQCFG
nr:DExH-box ATP-dependent RNA helicase DExH3 [Tanacetum cinerariifolium]